MLYNLKIKQKVNQTDTNIFGTKCLLTLGIDIIGKKIDSNTYSPFTNIEELITFKNSMRKPPKGNVPIEIIKINKAIIISGRLYKSNSLSHDPNIGALSLICATLRQLGWKNKIVITKHGLSQEHIEGGNKFVKIASQLNISFDGLTNNSPKSSNYNYWYYEESGEKLATIFIDLIVENFTNGYSIFENHAGCEKGYFLTKAGNHIPLKKYTDRQQYKAGDKSQVIHIPDLILIDTINEKIVNIEGKKYSNRKIGIKELNNFDSIEDIYIRPNYPTHKIIRTVILFGSNEETIKEVEIGFLLNENGKMVLKTKSPELFQEAIQNLISYYS